MMKFSLKEHHAKIFTVVGLILCSLIFSFIATPKLIASGRPKVVLFCADWNARCREARPAVESIVKSYNNVDFLMFNIDLNTTPEKARSMGLSIPRSVPYIMITDKNGQVISESGFNAGTPDQLRSILVNF